MDSGLFGFVAESLQASVRHRAGERGAVSLFGAGLMTPPECPTVRSHGPPHKSRILEASGSGRCASALSTHSPEE